MRSKVLLALLTLCSLSLWAGDKIQALDIKLGLWEITSTVAMTGMPAMPNIPPDVLAKMPPEQRAKMQAAMGGSPTTTVRKVCITKEKMDKQTAFNDERKNCTRTVVSSSSSKLDIKMQCTEQDATMNGTIHVEALSSENVKGTVRMAMNGGGRNMNMNSDFTSRYLGSACGDVK
jgi:uncharacterized protein DUF3617